MNKTSGFRLELLNSPCFSSQAGMLLFISIFSHKIFLTQPARKFLQH